MRWIFGADREVCAWIESRLQYGLPQDSVAIGLAKGGKIIAGVAYHDYRGSNIEMTIASDSPRWCTRKTLEVFFNYPFLQIGCRRVTAITDANNTHTREFLDRLGFVEEGILREATPDGDSVVYGLLKRECKWIKDHG